MDPEAARAAFAAFLDALPGDARVLVFHDFDADGVTASGVNLIDFPAPMDSTPAATIRPRAGVCRWMNGSACWRKLGFA